MLLKKHRKLTCDTVLLTKVQISFKFHKIICQCPLLFSHLIQDYTLYLVGLSSFSCMQQILINSLHFCYKYFLIFLVTASQVHPSFKRGHLISKYMGFLKVPLVLISYFDINLSFKSFLLCNHPLCFLFSDFIEAFNG